MKACLMRVNYDPKYTAPHQLAPQPPSATASDSLHRRLDLAREVYGAPLDRKPGVHKDGKGRVDENERSPQHRARQGSNRDMVPRKCQTELTLRYRPEKQMPGSLGSGKLEKHRDGVAKAHASIRLQPLQQSRKANMISLSNPTAIDNAAEKLYRRQGRSSVNLSSGGRLLYSPPKSSEPFKMSRSLDNGMIGYQRSKTLFGPDQQRKPLSPDSMERQRKARLSAERAMKDKKVFTILGPYHSLRLALRRRGWVEKFTNAPLPSESPRKPCDDDSDDDSKKENKVSPWEEENGYYGIMSHIVRNCTPAFLFTVKTMDVDSRVTREGQIINHFSKAKAFTTKVGLCNNIRNAHWFEDEDPDSFFPRCYHLEEAEEKEAFIDDYRLTACMGFLKYFVQKYRDKQPPEKSTEGSTESTPDSKGESKANQSPRSPSQASARTTTEMTPNAEVTVTSLPPVVVTARLKKGGKVQLQALTTAIAQCERFLHFQQHKDIDNFADPNRLTSTQWEQLILWFYQFIHDGAELLDWTEKMLTDCEELLAEMETVWPQLRLDGCQNVWIIKPGAKSRGRGIQCSDRLEEILSVASNGEGPYVIQKYIERPFLVHNTKFDIRQWFLVTDWSPLTVWFYKDCYLRFCSQEYTLDNFHVSIHLSNNSVQKNFRNGKRSDQLPEQNMWTSNEFQQFLRENGHGQVWYDSIQPGMKQALICSMLCAQEHVENRKSAFELYGADFMLTEDLQPWLIEINSSPSMARNTDVTAMMVDNVCEDLVKVVLDRKYNKSCDTGKFELIYRQAATVQDLPTTDHSLAVCGKRIRKRYSHHGRRKPPHHRVEPPNH